MSEIKVNKISPKQTCTTVTLGDSGDDFVVATGANLKTAAVKDTAGNVIVSRCGSNITIGSSGAAIALACGATQTGFGRTGTVDWDTTAKTANFTAVSGNGYFVNTTSGAITVTLPATPSAGDIVSIADYAGTAATNNITIARNGSNIEGLAGNASIGVTREARTYVYVDGTQGWVPVNTNDSSSIPPAFITATGGTVTCCGDYKIHTFTGPGTFCVSCAGNSAGSNTVDYLVVAGGGGATAHVGSGGGGGGARMSSGTASGCYTASPLGTCVAAIPVSIQSYPVTVGGGGAGVPSYCTPSNSGSNSVFSTITSAGGGGSGSYCFAAKNGGSGGGAPADPGGGNPVAVVGLGNTPPTSPPQGNNGGQGATGIFAGGGGGGAGAVATNATSGNGGAGGAGIQNNICGSNYYWSGGGGGSTGFSPGHTAVGGAGGIGGGGGASVQGSGPGGAGGGSAINNGGSGVASPNATGGAGGANSGGGGGGGSHPCGFGGAGGSGIVIIRYKFQ